MFDKQPKWSVQHYILQKYHTIESQTLAKNFIDDTEKTNILFGVVLDFIKSRKWEYFSEGNQSNKNILLQPYFVPQKVNCFDLSNAFVQLCRNIGIHDANNFIYTDQPLHLGKKLPGTSYVYQCFDQNQTYIDNQVMFDKHCVVNANGRFYDLVFSCAYDKDDEPFEKSLYMDLISSIETMNEEAIINKLKSINHLELERSFEGITLLFRAASVGLYRVASVLLNMGADANIRSNNELAQIPLECISDTTTDLFNLLYQNTEKPLADDILFALLNIETDSVEHIKDAINKGLPMNYQDSAGWTLLHWAAHYEREDIAKYLLGIGANANIRTTEEIHLTPLDFIENTNSSLFALLNRHTDSRYKAPSFFPRGNVNAMIADNQSCCILF